MPRSDKPDWFAEVREKEVKGKVVFQTSLHVDIHSKEAAVDSIIDQLTALFGDKISGVVQISFYKPSSESSYEWRTIEFNKGKIRGSESGKN